ncbi:MAG: hypothetical protein NVS9B9_10320 [Ktedonobacteraceae bacterium]
MSKNKKKITLEEHIVQADKEIRRLHMIMDVANRRVEANDKFLKAMQRFLTGVIYYLVNLPGDSALGLPKYLAQASRELEEVSASERETKRRVKEAA